MRSAGETWLHLRAKSSVRVHVNSIMPKVVAVIPPTMDPKWHSYHNSSSPSNSVPPRGWRDAGFHFAVTGVCRCYLDAGCRAQVCTNFSNETQHKMLGKINDVMFSSSRRVPDKYCCTSTEWSTPRAKANSLNY